MPEEGARKVSRQQKAYAKWLLEEGYVPFDGTVGDRNGVLATTAFRYADLKRPKARHEACQHAMGEVAIAEAAVAGDVDKVPKGWPGARPIQVWKARTAKPKA
jgi:hypothetical protein